MNFSIRLAELTKVRVSRQPTGDPNHLVVPLADDFLYNCPYLHLEDAGTLHFTERGSRALRDYLLKGGFIWADDSWGPGRCRTGKSRSAACCRPPSTRSAISARPSGVPTMFQIERAAADSVDLPLAAQRRRHLGAGRRRRDSVVIRGISDRHGNLMVLMTHNTDISDAWEREGEDPQYFYSFSPDGYAVGLNIVLYAMTH